MEFFTAEANIKTKQQMSSTSLPCAWLPYNYQFVLAIKISSIDFKTPKLKRQAALLSGADETSESAIPSKQLCEIQPQTLEQMMLLCYHIYQNSVINIYL